MLVQQSLQEWNSSAKVQIGFGLVVLLITCGFGYVQGQILADPDTWWHVKVGSDIWHSWNFPTQDHFSYTFYGHPWIAKEWLGQIILYLGYAADGRNGVWLVGVASVCFLAISIYAAVSRHLAPIISAGATLSAVSLSSSYFLARPFLLALPIMVIWTYVLFERARLKRSPQFSLLLLLILWANLHAGFTMGFVVAFFAFLDFAERTRFKDRLGLVKWIIFGCLCPVVTLFHPYTYQATLMTFSMLSANEAVPLITEWKPFNAQTYVPEEIGIIVMIFALLVTGVRFTWSKSAFLMLVFHMFLVHGRFSTTLFPLIPVVAATDIATSFPLLSITAWRSQRRDAIEEFIARNFVPFCLVAMGAAVTIIIALSAFLHLKNEKMHGLDAIAFAKNHRLTGHVMNEYAFGGPLIFNDIPTYIDGRSDQLFLDGFITADDKMQKLGGQQIFLDALRKYDIRWTIFRPTDPRVTMLDGMKDWKRAYTDEYAVIHVPSSTP